jgi:hypothetical protein
MSSLPTSAFKSPNKIFMSYLLSFTSSVLSSVGA